ncbi:MAG: hypothetical protein KZQ73_00015 [Candidatus Thiodiazotropha sp. (ex Semelilucina semeliformis)]|nr:hypothetical protein [Candidatus Thiodiazotropha sp. (ex Semelilucina semeliformis)]
MSQIALGIIKRIIGLMLILAVAMIILLLVFHPDMPIIIRVIYGIILIDVIFDYFTFVVLMCLKKDGLVGSFYKCIKSKLYRKKSNERKIFKNAVSIIKLPDYQKQAIIKKSLLGPKIAQKDNPYLRIILGGIPSHIRGGKFSFIKHYISNPISLDHFGIVLLFTAIMSGCLYLLMEVYGSTLIPIHIKLSGEAFEPYGWLLVAMIHIVLLVSIVQLWINLIYPFYIRFLHWKHWLKIILRA